MCALSPIFVQLQDIPQALQADYKKYKKAASTAQKEADKEMSEPCQSPEEEVGKEWWADMSQSHVRLSSRQIRGRLFADRCSWLVMWLKPFLVLSLRILVMISKRLERSTEIFSPRFWDGTALDHIDIANIQNHAWTSSSWGNSDVESTSFAKTGRSRGRRRSELAVSRMYELLCQNEADHQSLFTSTWWRQLWHRGTNWQPEGLVSRS